MAFKFKKWRIRWQKPVKKFKKIRRDRTRSRKAHIRFKKNRGKMKKALRITRRKGKLTAKKNKASGIYRKLKAARKRWKNILKSDMDLDKFLGMTLYEEMDEELSGPELEIIADQDIPGIVEILNDIKSRLEFSPDEEEDRKEVEDFIEEAIKILEEYETLKDIEEDDEEFLRDIISFIEEFAEEAGYIDDDDDEDLE